LTSPTTTRKQLDDLTWLLNQPEYEHRVVDIRTFIESSEYLNAGKECWGSIKNDMEELFSGNYQEAAFCEAIGAGKSFKSSIIIAYMVYRILCLKDPQGYFGLARNSGIYFLNMSIRADQSKRVVFKEIKGRVDNSPWFQKYYPPDSDIHSELRFPKDIVIFPGNSKETFPLGLNILGAVMDEASWYTETDNKDVAEEMFNALHNRIKNRFGDKGLLVMISSPRYVDDFMEKKMRESETNPRIFTRRKKLWDSKPASFFTGEKITIDGYEIPKEFEIEAKRNLDKFKRDYMAIPSLALEPYFKQWDFVERAIDPKIECPLDEHNNIKSHIKGKPGTSYYGHIDLSLTTDATGIAFCHKEGNFIIIDFMMKIKPLQGKEVDIAQVRGVVYDLKKRGFSIHKCTFDQFQSASSIQEFNNMGINSERLSIDKDLSCYETLKEGFNTERIRMYRNEELLMEIRRLEMIEGKKINHPRLSSKDLADAVAGAVYNAVTASDISFWVGGKDKKNTPEEQSLEDATRAADGLVRYGEMGRGGRYARM